MNGAVCEEGFFIPGVLIVVVVSYNVDFRLTPWIEIGRYSSP